MKTHVKRFAILLLSVLLANVIYAQFTKQNATELVLNTILAGETGKVDVFASTSSLSGHIVLIDNETIACPFTGNWVFFVDDHPYSGWYHSCRYIFVNAQTGAYTIVDDDIFPKNQSAVYQQVAEAIRPVPANLTDGGTALTDGLPPNNHYFAVIVSVYDNQTNWNDVSLVYNTLIQVYGYKKENIFVHYSFDGTSNTAYLNDLDDDDVNDLDYPATNTSIHATFDELAGNTNTNPNIPELGHYDQLAVFFTDVPVNSQTNNWLFWVNHEGAYYLTPSSPLVLAGKVANIDCAQMIFTFSINNGGVIANSFMDYSSPVDCENRFVHAATGPMEAKHYEQYITVGDYSEYIYYWASAARGVYPGDEPWLSSAYEVGTFPFTTIPDLEDHPGDFPADSDGDGYVQMEEAFIYATSMDTWSDDGYYYNPYVTGQEENPEDWDLVIFNEDVMTLAGYAGHVETPGIFGGNFIIGGHLIFDPVTPPDKFEFENASQLYMVNPQAKITILEGSHVKIKYEVKFAGNSILNQVLIQGMLTELDDGFTIFEAIDGGQWRGLVYDLSLNSYNVNFDNATFTDCLISGVLSNIAISNCVFTRSGIYLTASEVQISDCDFFRSYTSLTRNPLADNNDLNFSYNYCDGQGITKPAIEINSFGQYHLFYNEIYNHTDGIKIFNSGHEAPLNLVSLSYIENCTGAGIKVYNSDITMKLNHLRYNGYGLMLYNRSNVALKGNESAEYPSETNNIKDNTGYEVYSFRCFPYVFRWNAIVDEDNTEPMVYTVGVEGPYDVTYNYWGNSFDPVKDFYPWQAYNYIPDWNLMAEEEESDLAKDLYISAEISFTESNYSSAKTYFEQVISQYPNSRFVPASMKKLYDIEQYTGNNYSNLKLYYQNNNTIQGDSALIELADFLANFCDIKLENWPTAIAWFENVIQEPETFEDSIFAIIDLGYTYWLMENSGFKSSYTGTMPQYKFASHKDYEENRDYLLSLLPGDDLSETMKQNLATLKPGELLQNVPNPFNGTTQIWFKLTEESIVSVTIYDYTGKEVTVITPGSLKSGNHSVEFNSDNLSAGIYFYSLKVNGIKTDTKKMTLMK